MRRQALGLGQRDHARPQGAQRARRAAHDVDVLAEVVGPQRRGEARRAIGGQDVVGPGDVVAQAGRRPVADEDGTGVLHVLQHGVALFVGHHELQVLGRDGVGDRQSLVGAIHQAGDAGGGQCALQVGPAARRLDDGADFGDDPFEEVGVPGHQPGQAVGPVLGLDDDVDGGEGRVGRRAGDHDDLGRPGEGGRDAHDTRDLSLGLGHVGVAGAGDDVDGRDGGGAVGQGGDRLRPTHAVDLVHTGHRRRGQGGPVDVAVRPRRDTEGDGGDAGDPGGGGAHEDGGGVLCPAAGSVEAGATDRPGQVADRDAPVDMVARRSALGGVIGDDPLERRLERPEERRVGAGAGLLDLLERHPQAVGDIDPVEGGGGPDHGGVALGADLAQNGRDGIVDVGAGCVRARQDGVERRLLAAEVQDAEGHEVTRLPGCSGGPLRRRRLRWPVRRLP